jgi:hypothetical protein
MAGRLPRLVIASLGLAAAGCVFSARGPAAEMPRGESACATRQLIDSTVYTTFADERGSQESLPGCDRPNARDGR